MGSLMFILYYKIKIDEQARHFSFYGGSERIRTSGTVARTHAFQACSLNHSDTLPSVAIITQVAADRNRKLRIRS